MTGREMSWRGLHAPSLAASSTERLQAIRRNSYRLQRSYVVRMNPLLEKWRLEASFRGTAGGFGGDISAPHFQCEATAISRYPYSFQIIHTIHRIRNRVAWRGLGRLRAARMERPAGPGECC